MLLDFARLGYLRWVLVAIGVLVCAYLVLPIVFIVALSFGTSRWLAFPPPGRTLWEQGAWIAEDGWIRDHMLNEPRGGVFRHVNLLVPPKDPRAAMGFIIMEPADTPPMSGSNSLCVAAVLLEAGIVAVADPTQLAEILCVEEERVVGRDNTVSFGRLKLQLPPSPWRHHFVKARVKVRCYPDGCLAVAHGPRIIARYQQDGRLIEPQAAKTRTAA